MGEKYFLQVNDVLSGRLMSESTETREKETERDGRMDRGKPLQRKNEEKKIWGVSDSLIKRQGEEMRTLRCGWKNVEWEKATGGAGRDQYRRIMICSLWGSGGTAVSDIRDQSVCVHKCWFAFLLLRAIVRKRKRLGFSCCMQRMCDDDAGGQQLVEAVWLILKMTYLK